MTHQLGISLYPEHSSPEKDLAYMKKAAGYGFRRLFTCFLSAEAEKEAMIREFHDFCSKAHEYGFEVSIDTNASVFKKLDCSPYDIEVFHAIGTDIIRLDVPLTDSENIAITNNPYGIKIEFNASNNTGLDTLILKGADKRNMQVCHNFYPQTFTGIGWSRFLELTQNYYDMGLSVSAFVSSNNQETFGPWPVYDGLPTVEIHRGLPITFQARHLLATEQIDDILIGNCFASDKELAALSQLDLNKRSLKVKLEEGISEEEKKILFDYAHADRVDSSDLILRSSFPRGDYKNKSLPAQSCPKAYFDRGDVLIVNDELSHYRGEMQIVKERIPNLGDKNLVAKLAEREEMILDLLRPEHPFYLLEDKGKE